MHGPVKDIHSHEHTAINYDRAFGAGVILNVLYIVAEVVCGLMINSTALLADAGHNLSDVLGLSLAWGATHLAKMPRTDKRTYGFRKSTILAALLNALILMIAVGAISVEAVRKMFEPEQVAGQAMALVAGVGVLINGATALLFSRGREKDLNIRGAYLHMAADAAVSLGVVAAGVVISVTGWSLIDPLLSLAIVAFITLGTWNLLRESFHLSMDAVPRSLALEEVRGCLCSLDGVKEVHDLHVWAMSTTEIALTAHLVTSTTSTEHDDMLLKRATTELHGRFGIEHSTIQIERLSQNHNCSEENV